MRTKTWHFICLFQTIILIHDPCDLTSAIEVYLEERDDGAQLSHQQLKDILIEKRQLAWAACTDLGTVYEQSEEEKRCRQSRVRSERGSDEAHHWQAHMEEEMRNATAQLRKAQQE